jgi:hypothetical protein
VSDFFYVVEHQQTAANGRSPPLCLRTLQPRNRLENLEQYALGPPFPNLRSAMAARANILPICLCTALRQNLNHSFWRSAVQGLIVARAPRLFDVSDERRDALGLFNGQLHVLNGFGSSAEAGPTEKA